MTRYRVQIARAAKQDLKDIVSYIRFQLLEQGTAQRVYQAIREQIMGLDHMPERYPLWADEPWHSRGLRKLLVNHYVVLYLVDHEQGCVQVARIVYARRDIAAQLRETDWNDL